MTKRRFRTIGLRVRSSDDPGLPAAEASKARAFDSGWELENMGRPIFEMLGPLQTQGWLAARAARNARHFAINGHDHGNGR